MVVLDATIVNIALPSAQRDLHFSTADREWIVTAYSLAFGTCCCWVASSVISSGASGRCRRTDRLCHRVRDRRAGASFEMLVSARALQGALARCWHRSRSDCSRSRLPAPLTGRRAFGIFGAIAGGGASVGLVLGGALTQFFSWRWCLYVNLVIAVPTAIFALRLLVNHRDPERGGIDVPGVLTASAGLFALVYGFSNAETHGWTAPATIVALVASPVLLTAFVLIESRVKDPLLPLHIVRDRARGGAYLSVLARCRRPLWGVLLPYLLHAADSRVLTADHGRPFSRSRSPRGHVGHGADPRAASHRRQAARHVTGCAARYGAARGRRMRTTSRPGAGGRTTDAPRSRAVSATGGGAAWTDMGRWETVARQRPAAISTGRPHARRAVRDAAETHLRMPTSTLPADDQARVNFPSDLTDRLGHRFGRLCDARRSVVARRGRRGALIGHPLGLGDLLLVELPSLGTAAAVNPLWPAGSLPASSTPAPPHRQDA